MTPYSTDLLDQFQNNDLSFRTDMTHHQFAALSNKLKSSDIKNELINLDFFIRKLEKAKNLDINEVEKWLKNSWNTENVLNQNQIIIENTGQSFAIQWAFPQAYYSVFTSLIAHYKALGYNQESHSSVLKNFGTLIEQNKFPKSISFYCTGPKRNIKYINIKKPHGLHSIYFDNSNNESIDNQICQFLKATRELKLDEKAPEFRSKNKNGRKPKKLSLALWQKVSESIGHTTIMDLLYRKRIKANYRDIDTFSSTKLKGLEILSFLCTIVDRINLINECYIAKAIEKERFEIMVNNYLGQIKFEKLKTRLNEIKLIIN